MPENIESNQPEQMKKIESQSMSMEEILAYAGKLYKGLISLSNQKILEKEKQIKRRGGFPLDKDYPEVGDKEMLKTPGGKNYFFAIEKTKTGNPYLRITESHINKLNNNQEKNTMIVFQEGIKDFATMLVRIANKISVPPTK